MGFDKTKPYEVSNDGVNWRKNRNGVIADVSPNGFAIIFHPATGKLTVYKHIRNVLLPKLLEGQKCWFRTSNLEVWGFGTFASEGLAINQLSIACSIVEAKPIKDIYGQHIYPPNFENE